MDLSCIISVAKKLFKKRTRRILYLSASLFFSYFLIANLSQEYLNTTPVRGGSFSEGLVGYPRFINPVLALSQTDKDLSALLYAGLIRIDEQGQWQTDLANSIEINTENTEFTLTLQDNLYFHDGEILDIEDVMFTYNLLQDPVLKSPLYQIFKDVTIELQDENTIVFSLNKANPDFPSELTVGVMPSHIWADISNEEFPFSINNISPIGSGPYRIKKVVRDKNETITSYVLSLFEQFHQPAYIEEIETVFFKDQSNALIAFETGLVDNLANISAQELLALDHSLISKDIDTYPLQRSFALFMNTSDSQLSNSTLRNIISQSIDNKQIIREVFFNRASSSDSPINEDHPFYEKQTEPSSTTEDLVSDYFDAKKWQKNENGIWTQASTTASYTLHVPDVVELVSAAEIIASQLRSVGIDSEIVIVDESSIINDVIRKRDFQMVLFGHQVDSVNSLYAFWHSSGAADPGINISSYKNKTVDAILERLVDAQQDNKKTQTDYSNLQKQIRKDTPVVFLYHPHFIYASKSSIHNNDIQHLRFASDRFSSIRNWYTRTESLLPWFTAQ